MYNAPPTHTCRRPQTTHGAAEPSPCCVDASYLLRKTDFITNVTSRTCTLKYKPQPWVSSSPLPRSPLTHALPASVRLTLEQTNMKTKHTFPVELVRLPLFSSTVFELGRLPVSRCICSKGDRLRTRQQSDGLRRPVM